MYRIIGAREFIDGEKGLEAAAFPGSASRHEENL